MTHGTIEETYEYRIRNIVRRIIEDVAMIEPKNGQELEEFLRKYHDHFADAVLYDIETWMGFDDLLRQVQNA